ncbi:hypothetical protein [Escherichia coli]|uniref:hypothetical protein n=1 Tax=Escherichia coli TaxID=562 RepID=UPI00202BB096|nr:hypothetical protein [Escherichia coli]
MSELSYLEKLLDGVEVEWSNLGNLCDIFTGGELHKNISREILRQVITNTPFMAMALKSMVMLIATGLVKML